eukprot:g3361.t1
MDTVSEAFNRFDKDGSGSISRDELAEVLLELKPAEGFEGFHDEDIDQLLAAADSSGDGELQCEEFVKWVFAEDKEISQGLHGKYMLRISGCSRTQFNGEGVQWAVWKNSAKGKKGFALESQMVCSAIPELTQEEQLAKAEDCIKFDELYYKKVEKVLGERAVYRQSKGEDWGNTWIFYESAESRWKRGRELGSAAGASTSVFLNASRSGNESPEECDDMDEIIEHQICLASFAGFCRITDVPSPQLTVWMDETDGGKIDVVAVDTDGVPNTMGGTLRLNPSIPDGWKDKDFPHNETSIGKKVTSFGEPRWLRALALHPNPVLFADVEPADACQGRVGNCWLIAALSALAEYPSYFKKQVFITKKVSESGKYRIKLYDGRLLRWTIMEIDDYLPCSHYGGFKPELIFGKINDGKDKRRSEKLGALAWGTHFHETQRIGSWIKFKKLTGSGPETGWLSYYDGQGGERVAKRDPEEHFRFMSWRVSIDPRQVMEAITGDVGKEGKGADACFKYHFSRYVYPDEMWEKLKNYDKENYLMACTATQCKSESHAAVRPQEDEDAESGGELLGCTGLGTWNAPVIMQEGTLTDPGEGKASARFVNVPKCLHGKTLFALKNSTAEPGTWMMEYYPPTKLYVWLQKGKTGMLPLDEFLPKRGWDHEPTDGFQTTASQELLLFSKWLEEDEKYYALHTSWPIVGGVIGTFPLPKPPPAGVWTIEYEAPTMLYVWIQNGKYDAGVSEFLTADGQSLWLSVGPT